VFAAGDVTDGLFKQAITGVGEGVRAAYNAYKYVNRTQVICTDE
jgi:thioredoxin reductase